MGNVFGDPSSTPPVTAFSRQHGIESYNNNVALSDFVRTLAEMIPESSQDLKNAVTESMVGIVEHLSNTNPDFQCTVQPAGSLVEGSHVSGSDFDFVIDLTYFRQHQNPPPFNVQTAYGGTYVSLQMTRQAEASTWRNVCSTDDYREGSFFDPRKLKSAFFKLFKKSCESVPLRPGLSFYSDVNPIIHNEPLITSADLLPESPSTFLKLTWRGPGNSTSTVSVDLVLRSYIGRLPDTVIKTLGLADCRLTPSIRQRLGNVANWQFSAVGVQFGEWRVSWSEAERLLMKEIAETSPNAVVCYRVLKFVCRTLFGGKDVKSRVTIVESYVIKNVMFQTWASIREDCWSNESLGKTFLHILTKLQDVLVEGTSTYFAVNVKILQPSQWHKDHALPALKRLIATLKEETSWSTTKLKTLIDKPIYCSPNPVSETASDLGRELAHQMKARNPFGRYSPY